MKPTIRSVTFSLLALLGLATFSMARATEAETQVTPVHADHIVSCAAPR